MDNLAIQLLLLFGFVTWISFTTFLAIFAIHPLYSIYRVPAC